METINNRKPVYYSEYLKLDTILNAQEPESQKEGIEANDEMLFITIHQVYELWFKEILHELSIIRKTFQQPTLSNNSPALYDVVYRLKRINKILALLVEQFGIVETMTALDFLDFRDLLRPASGFQSIQFKIVEATLGLTYDNRFGKQYYLSQLNEKDIERVKKAEADESLIVLLNRWLERMPFCEEENYWSSEKAKGDGHPFWETYRDAYKSTLLTAESENLATFDKIIMYQNQYPEGRRLSQLASKNALFIFLYRDYPLLQTPFELLNMLLELDEHMSMWRHRHIHMVQRTIGKRVGTGGSTGAGYLKAAADSHHVFNEMAELTSFLLPRQKLPTLPDNLKNDLLYSKD
jgi:tryptophan 2,3-dioxygenase